MNKKRVFALLFSLLAVAALVGCLVSNIAKCVERATGYYVSTPEDLLFLSGAVNDGSTHLGVTIKQTADIDMSEVEDWTPIGVDDKYFYGTYDGCGYTIYNLTCKASSSNEDNALFGTLAGTVRNLKMENFDISGRHVSAFAVNAAEADENGIGEGKIINCYAANGVLNGSRCGVFGDDFTEGEVSSCVSLGVEAKGSLLYACSYGAKEIYGVFADCDIINEDIFVGDYNAAVPSGKISADSLSNGFISSLDEAQAIVCLNGSAYYSDLYSWKLKRGELCFGDRRISTVNMLFDGSGSKNDPYLISDYTDLMAFVTSVNLGRTFAGYYLRQTRDFDLSLINNWTPIGVSGSGRYFYGVYDGGGHKLLNIHCERTSSSKNNGLFGMLGGTVKNLALVGGEIYGDCTGGIASHSASDFSAAIYNCYSSVSVYGKFRAGGIADNFSGRIENCLYIGGNPDVYLVSYNAAYLINSYGDGRLTRDGFWGEKENCGIIGEDLTLAEAIEKLDGHISSMEQSNKNCEDLFSYKAVSEGAEFDLSSVEYGAWYHIKTIITILGVAAIIAMALVAYFAFIKRRNIAFE